MGKFGSRKVNFAAKKFKFASRAPTKDPRLRGRPRKYIPHRETVAEEKSRRETNGRIAQRHKAKMAALATYEEHCRLNNLQLNEGWVHWFNALKSSLLEPGTVRTMMKNAQDMHKRSQSDEADAMWLCNDNCATKPGRHAQDVTLSDLMRILAKVPMHHRASVLYHIATGSRISDQTRTMRCLVSMKEDGKFVVERRREKTMTKSGDRCTVVLPKRMLPPGMDELWRTHFAQMKKGRYMWSSKSQLEVDVYAATATYNTMIQLAAAVAGVARPTSYTFRRNFMHRMIWNCTDKDGQVDWAQVRKYSKHHLDSTVEAYYRKHVSDESFDENPWL